VFYARGKYIELDYHFVRERATFSHHITQHISSTDQVADLFSKPISKASMLRFQSKLCVASSPGKVCGRIIIVIHLLRTAAMPLSSHSRVSGIETLIFSIKTLTITLLQRYALQSIWKLSRRGSYNHAICNGNVLQSRWKPCSNSNALQSRWKLSRRGSYNQAICNGNLLQSRWKLMQFATVMLSNQDGNSAEKGGAWSNLSKKERILVFMENKLFLVKHKCWLYIKISLPTVILVLTFSFFIPIKEN